MKEAIKKYPIWAYLCFAFGFSWTLWSVLVFTTPPAVLQEGPPPSFFIFAALGGIGPSLAGIVVTAILYGKAGVHDLFARVKLPRVGIQWYAAALFISPLIGVSTRAVESALGKPTALQEEMKDTLPLSVIFPVFAALGEEFGWRGYLLPKLETHCTAFKASVLVGLAWGLWHIPTQVIAWRQEGLLVIAAHVFVSHVVGITAQSIVMAWIFDNTKHNLFLMVLNHYSITFTAMFMFPLSVSASGILQHWIIYDAFYWLVAAVIIASTGVKHFVRVRNKDLQA